MEKANAELRQMATEAEALVAAGKHDEAVAAFEALLAKGVASPAEVHSPHRADPRRQEGLTRRRRPRS